MIRMQIQLTEEQQRSLRELAASRKVTMARLIREMVDEGLRQPRRLDRQEAARRFLESAGAFHSGQPDFAQRHDEYLEEVYDS